MTARKSLNEYSENDESADDSDSIDELNNALNKKDYFQLDLSAPKNLKDFYFYNPIILTSVVLAFLGLIWSIYSNTSFETENAHQSLLDHLESKKNQFPSQDSSIWADILCGLEKLKEHPAKPAVYLLMFEEKAMKSSSCIVEIITTSANKYVLNNNRWLLLNGSRISKHASNDPGVLMETLSKQMIHSKIVIITDIQKIPAKLAQGFHFLTDEYHPKIEDAVYIFMLMIPEQDFNSSATEVVEKVLSNSWKELNNDARQALIIRIANVVLPVLQEQIMQPCPLKVNTTIEVNIP